MLIKNPKLKDTPKYSLKPETLNPKPSTLNPKPSAQSKQKPGERPAAALAPAGERQACRDHGGALGVEGCRGLGFRG